MKKNVYLLVLVLLFVYQTNAQLQSPDVAVQSWVEFDSGQERFALYAHNKDFCDYCLFIFHTEGYEGMLPGTMFTVSPGRKQIRTYKTKTGVSHHYYHCAIYRGNSAKKPNTDFIYALPVAVNEAVTAKIVEIPERHRLIFELSSDTIYACRSGVMCDDDLRDHRRLSYNPLGLSQVTLYHADGSFGEYCFSGKSLIAPGEKIKMGSPIAVIMKKPDKYPVRLVAPGEKIDVGVPLDAFEENPDKYYFQFSTYFLDKNKLRSNNPFHLFNKHTHFLPFFQTANVGKVRLENNITYTCNYTDELLMQEMSKREKKKYLKAKLAK